MLSNYALYPFSAIRCPKSCNRDRLKRRQAKIERNRRVRKQLLHARKCSTGSVVRNGPVRLKPTAAQQRGEELFQFLHQGLAASRGRHGLVIFPSKFSFIEAPDETIEVIRAIASASRRRGSTVILDQSRCALVDYGAEAAAIIVAQAARDGRGVRYSGRYPADLQQAVVAAATGLPQQLGGYPPAPTMLFETFGIQQGGKGRYVGHKSSTGEAMASRLTNYLNRCYQRYGFELKYDGKSSLLGLFGEVIGNAEDHGRGEWWVGGYLRQMHEEYGDCHLVILNLGRTIYETLQDLPMGLSLRNDIEALAQSHKSFFGRGYQEEQLWTLYAIQEGVGRFAETEPDRGRGLAEMIECFQVLGQGTTPDREPVMSLVSGRTAIRFDRQYPMQKKFINGKNRRTLAFNADNDLAKAPDKRNVRRLKAYFPGTVLSLRFYIDAPYLRQIIEPETDSTAP